MMRSMFHQEYFIYYLCILSFLLGEEVVCEETSSSNDVSGPETGDLLDKEYGVKYASSCEVCKFLSIELENRFNKLGQTSQVIETGYQIDGPKKRIDYTKSELYFIESLEGVCDELLEYKMHKERKDSNRIAKGMSSTFKTLHQLVDRGVKVDLGIPMELWDSPPAEITALKQQCEDNLEKYESIIEQWYWGERKQKLQQYLCRERVLDKDQRSCLDDPPAPEPDTYVPTKTHEELESDKKTDTKENKKKVANIDHEEL